MSKSKLLLFSAASLLFFSCKKDAVKTPVLSAEERDKKVNLTCNPASYSSIATTYNTLFTRGNSTTDQWTGADATYSIDLGDNKVLWIFGDTFVGKVNGTSPRTRPVGEKMNPNSFMLQDRTTNSFITIMGAGVDPVSWMWWPPAKTGTEYLSADQKNFYWPGDATIIGDNLYIFWNKFKVEAGTPKTLGTDLKRYSVSAIKACTATVSNIHTLSTTNIYSMTPTGMKETSFGISLLETTDSTYVYIADKIDYSPFGHWKVAKLYRVPRTNITGTRKYLTGYNSSNVPQLSGNTFSGSSVLSGHMKKLEGGVLKDLLISPQFSVAKIGTKYRLITQNEADQSKIVVYESNHPAGPWECETTLAFSIPEVATGLDSYNAFLHPHIKNGSTQYLLSYNLNTPTFSHLYSNVDVYRPKFIWVNIPNN